MFKKEDFKNGMVVQLDTGEKRLFWDGNFIDNIGFIPLGYYDDNLNNLDRIYRDRNIVAVYSVNNVCSMNDFFSNENLTRIWSRY